MSEMDHCGQLKTRVCPVCGKEFRFPTGAGKDYPYTFIDKTKGNYGKKHYCCSWSCLKKMQYEWIKGKEKFNAKDVKWLEANGYEVPVDKIPKWLLEERNRKDKDGI